MKIVFGLAGWVAATALMCSHHAAAAATEDEKIKRALQVCERRAADSSSDGLQCYTQLTHGRYPWEPQDAEPPPPPPGEPARNTKEVEIATEYGKDAILERWTTQNVRRVMVSNMDLNYVTATSGVKFGGDQTPNNMLYEGQVFENFSIARWPTTANEDARPIDFWFDAPVRIQLRQLTDPWKPVYTPSYNPGLRLMAAPTADLQPSNMLTYYSLGVHHYSNGQGPPPALPDPGPLDTTSQKFNTNYVEAAAYLVMGDKSINDDVNGFPWARVSFKQQFYGTWVPQMIDQYPKRSVTLEFRTPETSIGCSKPSSNASSEQTGSQAPCLKLPWTLDEPMKTQFRLATTYNSGYNDVVVYGGSDSYKTIPARFSDKLDTTAELLVRPWFFKQLWLYMRYDHGYDYYNINFQHAINRLQFGVAATPF
jgi:hypothetical protein